MRFYRDHPEDKNSNVHRWLMRRVMRSLSRHLRSPSVMESIIVFMLNWLRMISWKFMWELQHLTSEKSKTSKVAWIFLPKNVLSKNKNFLGFLLFWRENSNTCSVYLFEFSCRNYFMMICRIICCSQFWRENSNSSMI